MANNNSPDKSSLAVLPKNGRRKALLEKNHRKAAQSRMFSDMVTIVYNCFIIL